MFSGELIRAVPAPAMINELTLITGISNITPSNGTPLAGVAFTAPPSGAVLMFMSADFGPGGAGVGMIVGVRIRTGSTLGAGALVDGGEPGDGANVQNARLLVFTDRMNSGKSFVASGLVPGDSYNVAFYHYVTGGAASVIHARGVTVVPVL